MSGESFLTVSSGTVTSGQEQLVADQVLASPVIISTTSTGELQPIYQM